MRRDVEVVAFPYGHRCFLADAGRNAGLDGLWTSSGARPFNWETKEDKVDSFKPAGSITFAFAYFRSD